MRGLACYVFRFPWVLPVRRACGTALVGFAAPDVPSRCDLRKHCPMTTFPSISAVGLFSPCPIPLPSTISSLILPKTVLGSVYAFYRFTVRAQSVPCFPFRGCGCAGVPCDLCVGVCAVQPVPGTCMWLVSQSSNASVPGCGGNLVEPAC